MDAYVARFIRVWGSRWGHLFAVALSRFGLASRPRSLQQRHHAEGHAFCNYHNRFCVSMYTLI